VNHDFGTSLLAVVRIISVLGMSLAISGGLFLLLIPMYLPAALAFASFLPFFGLMRWMEKIGLRSGWGVRDEEPPTH
jgi:hypothetical protein